MHCVIFNLHFGLWALTPASSTCSRRLGRDHPELSGQSRARKEVAWTLRRRGTRRLVTSARASPSSRRSSLTEALKDGLQHPATANDSHQFHTDSKHNSNQMEDQVSLSSAIAPPRMWQCNRRGSLRTNVSILSTMHNWRFKKYTNQVQWFRHELWISSQWTVKPCMMSYQLLVPQSASSGNKISSEGRIQYQFVFVCESCEILRAELPGAALFLHVLLLYESLTVHIGVTTFDRTTLSDLVKEFFTEAIKQRSISSQSCCTDLFFLVYHS